MDIKSVRQSIKELCESKGYDYDKLNFTVIVDVDHNKEHIEIRPHDDLTKSIIETL